MDSRVSDQDVRSIYQRNAPLITSDEIWEGVHARIGRKSRVFRASGARRSRRKLVRVLGLAAAGVVLAGGVSLGVVETVKHLNGPADILVIGDDTSISPTTAVGGAVGIPDSQIDLGPADQIEFAKAWQQIAEHTGQSATTTWTEDFSLDFSPSGDLVAMSIRLVLTEQDILVSWDGRGGAADQEVLASIRTTRVPGQLPGQSLHQTTYFTTYGLYYAFAKIDEVGIAQILDMLPEPGQGGYYRVGQWESASNIDWGPDAYIWAGPSFEPFDQWIEKQPPISLSFVGIEGVTYAPEPSEPSEPSEASEALYFNFLIDKGIALPSSTVTTEAAPEFADLTAAWAARMITPLGVGHDESEQDAIFVELPADALAPPDGVTVCALLLHEAFLAVHRHDLPIDRLTIYGVDADGVRTAHMAVSLQTGMAFAAGWDLAGEAAEPTQSDGEKETEFEKVTEAACAGEYPMNNGMEWVAEERILRVDAWLPDYSDTYVNGVLETYIGYDVHEIYTGYLTELIAALEKLNSERPLVAVLQLSIDDSYGNPVLRDVHDFQLGASHTWYDGEEYRPPWMEP